MTITVKEATIPSDGSGYMLWLDNHHVMFRAVPSRKLDEERFYVWDVDHGTVVQDSRFLKWRPRVDPHTGEITSDGRRYKNYMDKEGTALPRFPPGTCFNPMDGLPCKTNPPPWVVPGGSPHGHTSTSKVALREEHGYLDRGPDGEDLIKNFPIVYYRTGITEPIPLGLGSQQVEPRVTYVPFAGAYLLEGHRSNVALAYPLWLLFPDGKLEQIFDPTGMPWTKNSRALQVVTKRGIVLVKWTVTREQVGESGLYFWENEKLTRVVEGAFQWPAVSPDGCRLAVIRSRLGDNLPYEERYVVQVIDVCQGGSDAH